MNDNLLKLRSVLKTMPLNDNQINNILGIIDTQNKEIDDVISPLLEQYYSYGIEKDFRIDSSNCIRVGNLDLHRSLPIQSRMRGCLLDDNGEVREYLPDNDWTSATRDGSKGQVMVHIPAHYRRVYAKEDNNIICVRLSELPLKGYNYVPDMFVSAYEASIERSSGKLCSVVNDSINYRGGNNNAEWDETYRSLLGRPVTNMNLSNFRSAARKRNINNTSWNCYLYNVHKTLIWLFAVEYATFNSQADYTSELTFDGFHQGGLGMGVTNLPSDYWVNFNNASPFIPCGYTDSLGNNTGVIDYTIYNEDNSKLQTVKVPRYRGIENIFGHLWKYTDGCKCLIQSDANGGLSKFYVCDEPANFTSLGIANYKLCGILPRNVGYIKTITINEDGDIIPFKIGADSITYFCDYFYTSIPKNGVNEVGVLLCSNSNETIQGGIMYMNIVNINTRVANYISSRLCFIPQQNKN